MISWCETITQSRFYDVNIDPPGCDTVTGSNFLTRCEKTCESGRWDSDSSKALIVYVPLAVRSTARTNRDQKKFYSSCLCAWLPNVTCMCVGVLHTPARETSLCTHTWSVYRNERGLGQSVMFAEITHICTASSMSYYILLRKWQPRYQHRLQPIICISGLDDKQSLLVICVQGVCILKYALTYYTNSVTMQIHSETPH